MKSRFSAGNFFAVPICLIVLMQFCCPDLWARPARHNRRKNPQTSATTYNSAKSARTRKPEYRRTPIRSRNFAQVDILLDDKFTLAELPVLKTAPGSDMQILDNPTRVRAQLPASQVQNLSDKDARILERRDFILVEPYTQNDKSKNETLGAEALTYIYGQNNNTYEIPGDNSTWGYSVIDISGAPSAATVTSIDVHYKIDPPWSGFVYADMTDESQDNTYVLVELADYYVDETQYGITAFNGEPVNQWWVIWGLTISAFESGYIDSWWIKVYYTGGGGGGYCDASTSDTFNEYISRVKVGDIDKSSGSSGYADYTAYSTQMQIGQGYIITVTNGDAWSTDVCGIWVDWNQDEDFDDAGETISVSGNPGLGPYTATITPPGYATLGETRMRVRIVDSSYDTLSPCGVAWYGEVEDYTIEVIEYQELPGRITGTKFNDLDADGNWDGAEEGIEGWEIYLDLNENGQYDTAEPNVTTDLNGFYEFADLPPDTSYIVAEIDRPGWQQTFPAGSGTHTIYVGENQVVENVNFGNYESDTEFISIPAIEDTYAKSGNPDTNYGSNESFCSGKISDSVNRAYLKFDMSSIPAGKTFVSARLRLDCGFVSFPKPQIGARYLVNDDWGQMTLTWNNAPTEFCPIAADTITISIDDNFWTVTDDVEDAYWNDGIYSLVLVSADEELAAAACFSSEEAIVPEWRPYLEIEFKDVTKYGGGSGTTEDPYKIWTPEQMNQIGLHTEDWDKHFILMADIDLSAYTGTQFNIIGNGSTPFTGSFDGNGNTISNFSYGPTASDSVGLFGAAEGLDTNIENLNLSGVSINIDGNQAGAIVGRLADGASLTNCSVGNGLIIASNDVGGLVGENNSATVQQCEFEGIVHASASVGGLVAYNLDGGTISNCSSKGTVIGSAAVGGLVGENSFDSLISTCYSLCDVQRNSVYHMYFGGLVGINSQGSVTNSYAQGRVTGGSHTGGLVGKNSSIIWNCYAVGSVSGTTSVGALVGSNDDTVEHSFWDTETCLPATGSAGGTGKTTAEMKMQSTFTDAGWDFVGETTNGTEDIWTIWEGAYYPRLACENPLAGDFSIDKTWMYQSIMSQANSKLTATASITLDPLENTGYTYEWEFILPEDVSIPPTITDGGFGDPCCTFAAPGCNQPEGLSDSGQPITIRVTVTGADFGNTGIAEAQFGIALLGDVNNDKAVNSTDRGIINAFWRLGAAGSYTFTDCNLNCDTDVNGFDRSIANAVWRGVLGQYSVTVPCPLR